MARIRYVRDEDGNLVDEREFSIEWTKNCTECNEPLSILSRYVLKGEPEAICPECQAKIDEERKEFNS